MRISERSDMSIFSTVSLTGTVDGGTIVSARKQTVVLGYYIFNAAATPRYVKFYNSDVLAGQVGTATPVLTFGIPAGGGCNVPPGAIEAIPFSSGLVVAAVVTAPVASTTNVTANDVICNIYYK